MYRTWMRVVVAGLLAATPLWADRGADKSAKKEEDNPAAAEAPVGPAAPTKEKENAPAGANYSAEIEQLRQMVLEQSRQMEAQREMMREQQGKLDALTEELRAARAAAATASVPAAAPEATPGATAAAPAPQGDVAARVEKLEKTMASSEGKIKGIGPFTFSGDIRLRYEPFFGSGPETCESAGNCPPDRHRQRFRLRFNVNAKLNDEISGGLTIASGNVGDPISTNQTEGDFFTRKPITIDKAFMTYKPKWFKPFSVTAGKYGYTWYRTELTFDNDLNPEGVSQQVMWDWKDHFLSHFGVVAFETPLFEVGGSATVRGKTAEDSAIFGGQIQTGWRLGSRVKLLADVAYYDYRNPDRIAQNQNNGNGFASSGTSTGPGGNFGFGGSNNSNNVVNVVVGTATTRFFASNFGIVDAILRADFDTGHAPWPIYALFNYAQNTRACSNADDINAFVAANPGATPSAFVCDPHQRHAYWAEARLGRLAEKNDFQFAYTFMRIERDSVVAAFNFSDLRQPTNVAQNRAEVFFQAYKNVTLGFTGLIGRQLITAQSLTSERWLKRLQFDVVYKF